MRYTGRNNPLFSGATNRIFSNARVLRQNMTEAEKLLWENLRKKRLNGIRFRRQHPIGHYIADFYCHEALLIIELDGKIHEIQQNFEHDEGRTFDLENMGLKVIRFTNDEVLENTEMVLDRIQEEILERLRH